ncbi:hypothetical protein [Pseudocolwellia agarivorans]|uniref:hypothetical protein n=1 Tax=Pseudocolwellia agarivorans TaxID=1911682 RepID=UPI0009841206|nr:hypothetical protein [Pseudocolwellia agarivorans]
MKGYRWTCNACSVGNASNETHCSLCGCSATAGTEDIEKHKNPEGFKKRKTIEEYKKQLLPLLFSPFFLVIYMHNGKFEIALLLFVAVAFIITKNLKLLLYISTDKKAKTMLITFSCTLLLFILTRIYLIPDNSSAVGWGVLFYFTFTFGFMFYFTKGKRFNNLLEQYYKES